MRKKLLLVLLTVCVWLQIVVPCYAEMVTVTVTSYEKERECGRLYECSCEYCLLVKSLYSQEKDTVAKSFAIETWRSMLHNDMYPDSGNDTQYVMRFPENEAVAYRRFVYGCM